ncbi:MAG: aldo/keto reductase [Proteobacteria bacterium]|nr:aldo/keto reductase [Pseudomonadota bacterium]
MRTRTLGRTGLSVSVLGLGCGAVGGLMVRGSAADRERVVARALEEGVTYFDTAPQYGDGQSETNLGVVLAALRPSIVLGTKVRLKVEDKADIAGAVAAAMDASLKRLGRDHVDLYQLHNAITAEGAGPDLTPRQVLEEVAPAFEALRRQGKTRFIGITAVGDTDALHQVALSGAFDTAQVSHNLLNPSAGGPMPAALPGQDYRDLLGAMARAGMGAIGIRALAGGALSGSAERHPIASPPPEPIGSAPDYEADLANAARFRVLVQEGHAVTLAEAAMRFAAGNPAIATTLIGIATIGEFDAAAAAVAKGDLPAAALAQVRKIWAG